ncbi:MAG: DNA polymerase IV [Acidobacteria bacterium]|nr:DNA polymerase IV [Acidobacteriota bacterium]
MPRIAQFRAKKSPALDDSLATLKVVPSILHVDMDAFYVSVELLDRPELIGKPVVVGGRPDQRGVVSAASYEARKFGVHSAMALRTAAKLCPHAVFLDLRPELYSQWSDRVAEILRQFSPIVEMASIDEAYLDLTGTERLHGPALAAAHALRCKIWRETKLPSSMGLASSRLVAKVASEQAKPRGLLWIPPGSEMTFFAPLSVRRIPGIGEVTEKSLNALGIHTVAQLAENTLHELEDKFGQWGTALYRKARGLDTYEFDVDGAPKSISHDTTFPEDTADQTILHVTLSHLCQKAGKRLREAGLAARTVTLTLRDPKFRTITRARTLPDATNLDPVIQGAAMRLLEKNWDGREKIRLIGVALNSLFPAAAPDRQLSLLDAPRNEKQEKLARAADSLRDRFGFSKVQLGASLRKEKK